MLTACFTGSGYQNQAEPRFRKLLENVTIPYKDMEGSLITLDKNGNFEDDQLNFSTRYYACADFDTDARIDMVTVATIYYGRSDTFFCDLFLFMNADGTLHYSDSWKTEDRINPQSLYINRKKEIEFRYLARAAHDGMETTPYILHVVTFRVRNEKLQVISHAIPPQ